MDLEIVKEVRFAVVMYGGVSLAIYINGVAQEILRLVRATSVDAAGSEWLFPTGSLKKEDTQSVYRDLAYLAGDPDLVEDTALLDRYVRWLKSGREGENPIEAAAETPKKQGNEVRPAARFVVDILSGSSAGGINGIYLAKALSAGQSLASLEKLWLDEGDFSKLINDDHSTVDAIDKVERKLGLNVQDPPRSLLNAERMYLKLLTAFANMDDDEDPEGAFVDEVDLFVTMTDYWGIPVPIRLFDQLIHERRHRQNLHFRFRKHDDLDEFKETAYPFLAFAARCTSSFPLAFDPMQLEQANTIIKTVRDAYINGSSGVDLSADPIPDTTWERAFKPATVRDTNGQEAVIAWNKRVFVDGGYLDNKPFGYAISALAQKQSDVFVERKLIYVEPNPELDNSQEIARRTDPPGALQNTLAALNALPTYETIREDLQEVLQRNRLVSRVNQILTDARIDELDSLRLSLGTLSRTIEQQEIILKGLIDRYGDATPTGTRKSVKWESLELGEIAQQKGQIAYPYYRLRVAALTDTLARMVTQRAGYDEDSDYFLAVRDLVYTWRRQRFSRGEEGPANAKNSKLATPMLFLRDYDFDYRQRRLRFVLQQADRLLQFDDNLKKELLKTEAVAEEFRERFAAQPFSADHTDILKIRFSLVDGVVFEAGRKTPSEFLRSCDRGELAATVRSFKKSLNLILRELRRDLRQVQPNSSVDAENPNKQLIDRLNKQVKDIAGKMSSDELEFLLGKETQNGNKAKLSDGNDTENRRRRAELFLSERKDIEQQLTDVGETLRTIYDGEPDISIFSKCRTAVYELFNAESSDSPQQRAVRRRLKLASPSDAYLAVREYLWHFYDHFDAYDQVIFPITYETPVGEGAVIDVARISPLDATNLTKAGGPSGAKGAGTAGVPTGKLAGSTFLSFGAFFSRSWRENDILWGRLDAAERLISVILHDGLIRKKSTLQAAPIKKALHEVRKAMIDELQETILEQSPLVKKYYNAAVEKDPSVASMKLTEYISQRYLIDRKLHPEDVFATTERSVGVLQRVFPKGEFGKFDYAKGIALSGFRALIRPNFTAGERRRFLMQFLPVPAAALVLALLLVSAMVLAPAAVLSYTIGSAWPVIIVLLIELGVIGGSTFLISRKISAVWGRVRSLIETTLYSKVTGVEPKKLKQK